MRVVTFGLGGFNTSKPANNVIGDVTVADPAPIPVLVNADVLAAKANAALTANAVYLAIGAPTNPQVVAQVDRLTRECSAIIRLLLAGDLLLDVTNT